MKNLNVHLLEPTRDLKPGDKFLWTSGSTGESEIHTFHSNAGYGVKTYTDYNPVDGSSLIVNWSGVQGIVREENDPPVSKSQVELVQPTSWAQAWEIQDRLNEGKVGDDCEPRWYYEGGFKLEFAGPLVEVDSSITSPSQGNGLTWQGEVVVFVKGIGVIKKPFDAPNLGELRRQIEAYVGAIKDDLFTFFPRRY